MESPYASPQTSNVVARLTYNQVRLAETEETGTVTTIKPVFITEHLPQAFQKQKRPFFPSLRKPEKKKKRPVGK